MSKKLNGDELREKAKRDIEKAHKKLSESKLTLNCIAESDSWNFILEGKIPILNGIESIRARPTTLPEECFKELQAGEKN